jgi:hypothetical protein
VKERHAPRHNADGIAHGSGNPFHHRFERSHRSGGAYLKTTDGSQVTNCGNITTISKPIN